MKCNRVCASIVCILFVSAVRLSATNGDNLIGVGPASRSMGGTGIAVPQDAISAVFANPAAMCTGPFCPASELSFAGTIFMPRVHAVFEEPGRRISVDSKENVYMIPAIGISIPINPKGKDQWRFGLAAYGVTGLGVDYRGTDLDQMITINTPMGPQQAPLIAGEYSSLMIMKFAPSIAYQPAGQKFAFGLALHVDYATLDLRNGASPAYGIGVQPGVIVRPTDSLTLGLTYLSPQSTDFSRVIRFGSDQFDLELEAPQQVGLGVGYELFDHRLLVEVDVRWVNWADAKGYSDFDWNDQWIVGVGAQYELVLDRLFLRAGYNYGENPLKENNGWSPARTVNVQGAPFPEYYYETFRIIGFPAIVEHHLTAGIAYYPTQYFSIQAGFMYAFKSVIEEDGFGFNGPVTIRSDLQEYGVDFGLNWRF